MRAAAVGAGMVHVLLKRFSCLTIAPALSHIPGCSSCSPQSWFGHWNKTGDSAELEAKKAEHFSAADCGQHCFSPDSVHFKNVLGSAGSHHLNRCTGQCKKRSSHW